MYGVPLRGIKSVMTPLIRPDGYASAPGRVGSGCWRGRRGGPQHAFMEPSQFLITEEARGSISEPVNFGLPRLELQSK